MLFELGQSVEKFCEYFVIAWKDTRKLKTGLPRLRLAMTERLCHKTRYLRHCERSEAIQVLLQNTINLPNKALLCQ